jgi:hypothetical protein
MVQIVVRFSPMQVPFWAIDEEFSVQKVEMKEAVLW